MALQTSSIQAVAEVVGQYAPIAFGVATASGTSLDVTIPQFVKVYGAIVLSTSTTTAGYTATTSGNNFDATVGTGEVCMWIAFGQLKA